MRNCWSQTGEQALKNGIFSAGPVFTDHLHCPDNVLDRMFKNGVHYPAQIGYADHRQPGIALRETKEVMSVTALLERKKCRKFSK